MNYIALDWAQSNMAISRMIKNSNEIKTIDVPSSIRELREYLKSIKGRKVMTIEESNTSQWLYTEIKPYVDKLIICDPYRNKLLSEGAQDDKIDSRNLVKLLSANLLKEVFHTYDEIIYLRNFVSGYDDLVKVGVASQNRRKALFRSVGKDPKEDKLDGPFDKILLNTLDKQIAFYQEEKEIYEKKFKFLCKKYKLAKLLLDIPGIGEIHAIKILAYIVDARRFPNTNHFLSYCGLIKLTLKSGKLIYGKKKPRCNKQMKYVFNLASKSALRGNNEMSRFYDYLLNQKHYSEEKASHSVTRYIARVVYGVLKTGTKYKPFERRQKTLTSKSDL